MKNKGLFRCLTFGLLLSGLAASVPVLSEDTPPKSQLSLPWEDFKKLLRIDENEIVLPLDTFNRLVAFTGAKKRLRRVSQGRASWSSHAPNSRTSWTG
jgi:hypothetical protein